MLSVFQIVKFPVSKEYLELAFDFMLKLVLFRTTDAPEEAETELATLLKNVLPKAELHRELALKDSAFVAFVFTLFTFSRTK